MPKCSTFPYLFDQAKHISTSELRKWFYFNSFKTGTITWSRNGYETGSIGVTVKIDEIETKEINQKLEKEKVDITLSHQGFEDTQSKFSPHLTLGRIKHIKSGS